MRERATLRSQQQHKKASCLFFGAEGEASSSKTVYQSEKQHRIKAGIFFNIKGWIKPQTYVLKGEKNERKNKTHTMRASGTQIDIHINFSFYTS